MSTTNGYNATTVLPVLMERKGWEQPTKTGSPTLNAANLTNLSGKPFQDHHAACTIENLLSTQEDERLGDTPYTLFNTYLQNRNKATCMEVLQMVFNRSDATDLPAMQYNKAPNTPYTSIPNQGKFVGYQIEVANGSFTASMDAVTLLFDGVATFNLYLYHEQKDAAIATKSVTTVANYQTTVTLTEWVLQSIGNTSKGGTFYVGYYQADLGSVKALEFNFNGRSTYHCIRHTPISATVVGSTFSRNDWGSTQNTYGLNFQIATYRDYSGAIISRSNEFDQIIGDIMAKNVLEKTLYNVRTNATQRINQEQNKMLYTDLTQEGQSDYAPYVSGLKASIKREVLRLQKTFYGCEGINYLSPNVNSSDNVYYEMVMSRKYIR